VLAALTRTSVIAVALGQGCRVKAREATAQRLGLNAVVLVKIMGSEEDAPLAWKVGGAKIGLPGAMFMLADWG
jgi:hypothetical protein